RHDRRSRGSCGSHRDRQSLTRIRRRVDAHARGPDCRRPGAAASIWSAAERGVPGHLLVSAGIGATSRHPSVRRAMRTLLICHEDAPLDREGLVRWLGSFSTVVGTVVIREPARRLRKRVTREISRVGLWRFLDVMAFRAYYTLVQASRDRRREQDELE